MDDRAKGDVKERECGTIQGGTSSERRRSRLTVQMMTTDVSSNLRTCADEASNSRREVWWRGGMQEDNGSCAFRLESAIARRGLFAAEDD